MEENKIIALDNQIRALYTKGVDVWDIARQLNLHVTRVRQGLLNTMSDDPYRVVNLDTDESHGTYNTLAQARGCVRYDKLTAYAIWRGDIRIECCEPYSGNDDRALQGLGMANASER